MPYRNWPRKTKAHSGELFSAPKEKTPEDFVVAHIDGGARGNPGPAGYGIVIEQRDGSPLARIHRFLGLQTNNFAEYSALLATLEYALAHDIRALKVVSDSELLVRQMNGQYKVRSAPLQELHRRAKELVPRLEWFRIEHARREHNREADRLANLAMDEGS
jgi:ribonuclease HI